MMPQTITINPTSPDDFDVIALENRLEETYSLENTPYLDSEIEVDNCDRFSSFYRLWCGRHQLGAFFRSLVDDSWQATAFYQNGHFADESKPKSFDTYQQAQDYIVQAYFG